MSFERRAIPQGAVIGMMPARDGWGLRCFDWPSGAAHPRGSILFQGGRGDIIEKYLESFGHWHVQGWHVSAFDWRGQGGSGRLSKNPHVGHIDDFGVWIDDLAEMFASWKGRTPGPHVIIAHSMGGHLVLRALAERRIAPDAAVLVAPMLGFATAPLPLPIATGFAKLMARVSGPDKPAWPRNEKPTLPGASRQKLLTGDDARYADELWWKAQKPELELGPPSWPWLVAAYASNDQLGAPGALESIQTPVLFVGTDGDRLVSPPAIRKAASRLPNAALKMFDQSVAHEILRERDGPRDQALAAIDAFLDREAPPK
jgi:lysophospholipase